MLYNAGKLRHRITIEQRAGVADEYGDISEDWTPLATLWAEAYDRSGNQVFSTEQYINAVTTHFRIRHRSDLNASMRISWRGDLYDIESILDVSGNRNFIELVAVRQRNDG